ncbi:MAG TPA: ATP-binding protein, partial [Verrucomicrobiae bacterium]|nr:ATP-binding protein [Verrucomicrobiae bacterium]
YALRLNRLFGMTRVGWSLFSAFGLLAFLHLTLSVGSLRADTDLGIKVDVIYTLISILLLIGMAHLETLLKERLQIDQMREQAKVEMQQRVSDKTEELTRANEELRAVAARLRAEIAERKQMQEQMQKTHNELMVVSREAGMSEVATGVLHNVGNVLNSVNVSASLVADHLQQLKIHNVTRAANLMRDQGENIGLFMCRDPRGKQLPDYLAQLADHLHEEQSLLLREIGFVKKKIEHIKEIVATQQSYGKVAALTEKVQLTELVEDVLRIQFNDLTRSAVRIERDYAPRLPEVIVDKHKVLQILLNLITNARHACLESGQTAKQVTVRVTNGHDRVRVSMSDNGVGIPPENLKKIFNHGFTTKKKGGHGFGLHSGALAAKEMGGALVAESNGVGRGATFTLELPLQAKPQKA